MPNPVCAFLASNAALEAAAAVEHERWSHWQSYLHSQGERLGDGSLLIPAHLVERWERQVVTSYAELEEGERESDREQAQVLLTALRRLCQES